MPTAWLSTGKGTEVGADPRLALIIHLMAATLAGRDMVLFTFGDTELKDKLCREGKEVALTLFQHQISLNTSPQVAQISDYGGGEDQRLGENCTQLQEQCSQLQFIPPHSRLNIRLPRRC